MSDCQACLNPDSGAVHTCPDSGTFRAAEAHVAGAVDEIAEAWPSWTVSLHFRARASDEPMLRTKLTGFVSMLLTDDTIDHADFSIQQVEA